MRITHKIEKGKIYLMFEIEPENNKWRLFEILNYKDIYQQTWDLLRKWSSTRPIKIPGTESYISSEELKDYVLTTIVPLIQEKLKWDLEKFVDLQKYYESRDR